MNNINKDAREAVFAEEAFVVDVQSFLHGLMLEKGISKSDLAEAMGVSRARISQIFSDECKNFTVRSLAKAMFALGEKPKLVCEGGRKQKAAPNKSAAAAIRCSAEVLEFWQDNADADEGAWPCNDNDHRISGMLRLQHGAGMMACG